MAEISPAELYEIAARQAVLSPESVYPDICSLLEHHLHSVWGSAYQISTANTRVQIRALEYHEFDYRRYWELATVWFDGKPVMITQNAGREGDDHSKSFITDAVVYGEMLGYLISLAGVDNDDLIDPNVPRGDLTAFYGAEWVR